MSISLWEELLRLKQGAQGSGQHSWECSQNMWILHLRTWFSGGAVLMVGLDDL